MGYDEKYQWSWVKHDEAEPCSDKIEHALYASIYDETPNKDVTRCLLRALSLQFEADYDEEVSPNELSGRDAWQFCYDLYEKRVLKSGLYSERSSIMEVFGYPESLPDDFPIPKKVLRNIAARMAQCDITHAVNMKKFYQQQVKEVSTD